MQSFCRASVCTFIAENALRLVFSPARLLVDLHIHGASPQTFAAADAFALIAVDAQRGKITHRLEEYRDRTQIFAERPVIFERNSKRGARDVIERISGEKQPEHDLLQICNLHQKQPGHQRQRQNEHPIAQNAKPILSWLLRLLVGQEIQHHRRPAGVAAPSAPKEQRAKNFRYRIVDGRCLKGAEEEVVPEALDLHILAGDHTEVQQHIAPDRQLHEASGIALPGGEERRPQRDTAADIAEIQQIKEVILHKPQCNCHSFKQKE